MAEEMNNQQEQGMEQDYLDTIQDLKKNTVSREVYDKQIEENRKLLNALVSGAPLKPEKAVEMRSADEVRKELFGKDHTNLRYAELSLELRDAVMAEGGEDPFVPQGKKIKATREDRETADMVAAGLRHCIEYANGDSAVFTNELQRITDDVVISRRGYR